MPNSGLGVCVLNLELPEQNQLSKWGLDPSQEQYLRKQWTGSYKFSRRYGSTVSLCLNTAHCSDTSAIILVAFRVKKTIITIFNQKDQYITPLWMLRFSTGVDCVPVSNTLILAQTESKLMKTDTHWYGTWSPTSASVTGLPGFIYFSTCMVSYRDKGLSSQNIHCQSWSQGRKQWGTRCSTLFTGLPAARESEEVKTVGRTEEGPMDLTSSLFIFLSHSW